MSPFQFTSEPAASSVDQQVIIDAVDEFNMVTVNDRNYTPVCLFVRDESGQIVGGLLADIWGGWLHVNYLWVSAALRGQGFGTQLVRAAEDEARQKGCRGALLETFSFQAPEFYRRLGYEVVGQLNDYPTGHTHFIMSKPLI